MKWKPLLGKANYLFSGLSGRISGVANCPSCGSNVSSVVDRKFFHILKECSECHLLYRFPVENASAMDAFYQHSYAEPGLVTELPDDYTLTRLLDTEFKGSGKDFSYHISVLRALGLKDGGRILDYGANWGYMTWQFLRAGFDVSAFEISVPRALYGRKLGVDVKTKIQDVGAGFDMVYSCHVLEHVPDPAATLREQLDLLKPGGLVVAHTPNGCRGFREKHQTMFHQTWGQVHPVLLTDEFIAHVAGDRPYFVSSIDTPETLASWDQQSQVREDTSGTGFVFAIRQ
jgi:SAM-dependent methyltransferase